MKLKKPGTHFFPKKPKPEILNITPLGIWLLMEGKEYYVDFANYPWFLDTSMREIYNVEGGFGTGIYWPDLDLDISIEALDNPEKFPLIAKFESKTRKPQKKKSA